MNKVIKVFIADASEDFRDMLADSINAQPDMCVCGMAADGLRALEMTRKLAPEVLVTDILLREMDGIEVLKELQAAEELRSIVVSGFFSDRMAASLGQLHVDYYFPKPCHVGELVCRIRELAEDGGEEAAPREEVFQPMVREALRAFGMLPHLKGYPLFLESISRTVQDRETLQGVTKILYPELAKAHHSTAANVERCMRNAVEVAWERGDPRRRDAYFGKGRFPYRPANTVLIAVIAEMILNRYYGMTGER